MIEDSIDCTPVEVGYNGNSIRILDSHFETLIKNSKIHCACYVLSRYGRVFSCKAFGPLTYKNKEILFTPGSIRRINSLTKAFTVVAIMQLIEREMIGLHQPVKDIIDEFNNPIHEKISIFHLLTHTSGIIADPDYFMKPDIDEGLFWSKFEKDNWISEMLKFTDVNSYGKNWNYSSTNYAILGEIIKRKSGFEYKSYIHENILKPLGLNNTWLGDMPEEFLDRICFTSQDDLETFMGYYKKNSPLYASGGIDTTVKDLHTFALMLLNKGLYNNNKLLSSGSINMITNNQLSNVYAFDWGRKNGNFKFGLGSRIIADEIVTTGSYEFPGSGYSYLVCDPQKEFIGVWFVPTNMGYTPEAHTGIRSIMWSGLS